MRYRIKIIYTDGQTIDLTIPESEQVPFFEALTDSKIYWSCEEKLNGFWLDIARVRYVQCFAIKEAKLEEELKDDRSERDVLSDNNSTSA